jgi:chromosome segregation ATPase
MAQPVLAWIIGGLALAAAFVLFMRLRAANGAANSATLNAEQLERELRAARKQLEKHAGSRRRKSGETQELQRKLDKARKRAARAREGQQSESERIKELERELELRAAELRNVRRELSAKPEGARPVVRAVAPTPAPKPEAAAANAEAQKLLQERAEKAEVRLKELGGSLATARRDVERLRERTRTQDKLYLAIHGELAAKKDRIRHLTEELERLRAFKVAVFDPVPGDEPEPAGESPEADDETVDPESPDQSPDLESAEPERGFTPP